MLPVLDIPLLVREEDAAHAERILQEYLDTESSVSARKSRNLLRERSADLGRGLGIRGPV